MYPHYTYYYPHYLQTKVRAAPRGCDLFSHLLSRAQTRLLCVSNEEPFISPEASFGVPVSSPSPAPSKELKKHPVPECPPLPPTHAHHQFTHSA